MDSPGCGLGYRAPRTSLPTLAPDGFASEVGAGGGSAGGLFSLLGFQVFHSINYASQYGGFTP
jgi:hypothetical protein